VFVLRDPELLFTERDILDTMIAIYEDMGGDYEGDDYVATAVFEEGVWLADARNWQDRYPDDITEEDIAGHLTGPNPVVVDVTENSEELIQSVREREGELQ
jgi:hypothetical protein